MLQGGKEFVKINILTLPYLAQQARAWSSGPDDEGGFSRDGREPSLGLQFTMPAMSLGVLLPALGAHTPAATHVDSIAFSVTGP